MTIAPDPLSHAAESTAPQFPTISKSRRLGLWLLAWAIAAVATVAPAFPLVILFWMFPVGLAAPFGAANWSSAEASYGVMIIGWLFYVALSIYALRQRKRIRYFWAYTILLVFLAFNVAGCRYEIAHTHIC